MPSSPGDRDARRALARLDAKAFLVAMETHSRIMRTWCGVSEFLGAVSGQNRRQLAPVPHCLAFYSDGLVIVPASNRVHFERFKAGAAAGNTDVATDWHLFDGVQFGKNNERLKAAFFQAVVAQAQAMSSDELRVAHPRHAWIANRELERVTATGLKDTIRIRVSPIEGSSMDFFCPGGGDGTTQRLNLLIRILGERFTMEKITWSTPPVIPDRPLLQREE